MFLFGPSLLQITNSLLVPGSPISILSTAPSPLIEIVPPLPSSLAIPSLIISLSGPSIFSIPPPNANVCWEVAPVGEGGGGGGRGVGGGSGGGRGIDYELMVGPDLAGQMVVMQVGWIGGGKGKVCLIGVEGGEGGLQIEGDRNYTFGVRGRSRLFGSVSETWFSFYVLGSDTDATPQLPSPCSDSLFSSSVVPYGIVTTPSGNTFLPPSLRFLPLTITTKALSPCGVFGMAKDILTPSTIEWTFLDTSNTNTEIDLNEWANGTSLDIPSSILQNRQIFPPNVLVPIRVTAQFFQSNNTKVGEKVTLFGDVAIGFGYSPIVMVADLIPVSGSIFDVSDLLILDFSDSYTYDGIVMEGGQEGGDDVWVWEWDWECIIPGEHRGGTQTACVYEGGEQVVMPGRGESRFEGGGGIQRFEAEVPLFWTVKGRVRRGAQGPVVAEGKWSGLLNPVEQGEGGLEILVDRWVCPDSSVGFLVCLNFCFVFFLFFPHVFI